MQQSSTRSMKDGSFMISEPEFTLQVKAPAGIQQYELRKSNGKFNGAWTAVLLDSIYWWFSVTLYMKGPSLSEDDHYRRYFAHILNDYWRILELLNTSFYDEPPTVDSNFYVVLTLTRGELLNWITWRRRMTKPLSCKCRLYWMHTRSISSQG